MPRQQRALRHPHTPVARINQIHRTPGASSGGGPAIHPKCWATAKSAITTPNKIMAIRLDLLLTASRALLLVVAVQRVAAPCAMSSSGVSIRLTTLSRGGDILRSKRLLRV